MFKKLIYAMVAALTLAACDKKPKTGQLETTKTGLRYIFHQGDTTGKKAKLGDVISLKMIVRNHKDSIVSNTAQAGPDSSIQVTLQPPAYKGALEEGLGLLSAGDSVTFLINVDSLAKQFPGQPIPPAFKKGADIKYTVKVKKIQTQDEITKERDELASKQKETDAKLIEEYIAKNKLTNVQKTPSGLNYIITDPGTGKIPQRNDSVTVHYTLKKLDGTVLESSKNSPDPSAAQGFTFPLGIGSVIPGWDEGIGLFKEGGKGTLIVPSGLAYGPQDRGPRMPANSILVFDIELLKVKNSK